MLAQTLPQELPQSGQIVALVDANNFYVSAERVFQPWLEGRPVGVLSNNDSCFVARSSEVKAIGIKNGTPIFECADLVKKHNIVLLSSNYTLYGSMSSRMMLTLSAFTDQLSIYSVDEAFLGLPTPLTRAEAARLTVTGQTIRAAVKRNCGLPVSVGLAPTHTLAKLVNSRSKKDASTGGVLNWLALDEREQNNLLADFPIEDIWGIGRRRAELLHQYDIHTAFDLAHAEDGWVKKHLGIVGLRTVWELRGIPCIPLELGPQPKKAIGSAKSFGRPVTELAELEGALAVYVSGVALKLRRQSSATATLQVFLHTSFFRKDVTARYGNSITLSLDAPTSYTPRLVESALRGLRKIYRAGYEYQKVGVLATELSQAGREVQLGLFDQIGDVGREKESRVMAAMDDLNRRMGRDTVRVGRSGFERGWKMRQAACTPHYTTRWEDILQIAI